MHFLCSMSSRWRSDAILKKIVFDKKMSSMFIKHFDLSSILSLENILINWKAHRVRTHVMVIFMKKSIWLQYKRRWITHKVYKPNFSWKYTKNFWFFKYPDQYNKPKPRPCVSTIKKNSCRNCRQVTFDEKIKTNLPKKLCSSKMATECAHELRYKLQRQFQQCCASTRKIVFSTWQRR